MLRVLMVLLAIACFGVAGCKKKDSVGDPAVQKKAVERKVHTATEEVETSTGMMEELQ